MLKYEIDVTVDLNTPGVTVPLLVMTERRATPERALRAAVRRAWFMYPEAKTVTATLANTEPRRMEIATLISRTDPRVAERAEHERRALANRTRRTRC